jgi:hypothetical protein
MGDPVHSPLMRKLEPSIKALTEALHSLMGSSGPGLYKQAVASGTIVPRVVPHANLRWNWKEGLGGEAPNHQILCYWVYASPAPSSICEGFSLGFDHQHFSSEE